MRYTTVCVSVLGVVAITGALAMAQQRAASPGGEKTPTIDDFRRTVSRLRGNRIETPTNYDALSAEQKAYVASILSGPRSDISGPLGVMMVAPALGDLSQKAIAYSRFAGRDGFSIVPPKLNELAILVVAKHWSAEYVWNAHHSAGVRNGLPAEVVEAIRVGKPPSGMDKDVAAVYHFATEFITARSVSDATLAAAKAVLGGDRGVVDLVGTMGLYQISSMMVSLDETPLPNGVKPYLHPAK
ncbi:MAG: carboxymuconolactone decarboxylase family protein [Acidobacteriota bacterium]